MKKTIKHVAPWLSAAAIGGAIALAPLSSLGLLCSATFSFAFQQDAVIAADTSSGFRLAGISPLRLQRCGWYALAVKIFRSRPLRTENNQPAEARR